MTRPLLTFKLSVLVILLFLMGGQTDVYSFTHPGLLHDKEDIARIRGYVNDRISPAIQSYEILRTDKKSSAQYKMNGPYEHIARDGKLYAYTKGPCEQDCNAAYYNALMWVITNERPHAEKAMEIIRAYASTLKGIHDHDGPLCAGLQGFMLINACELMRYTFDGWTKEDTRMTSDMFVNVFLPVLEQFYKDSPYANGNWGIAVTKMKIAIAVYTDNRAMYDEAIDFYLHGNDNGSLPNYIGPTGQQQESGRDQPHCMLGLGCLAEICEVAWHQGDDLYGALDNRLLVGYEYLCKYNLGYDDVPFIVWQDKTPNKEYSNWTTISDKGRGQFRSVFEIAYAHYVNRMHKAMPYTKMAIYQIRPEKQGFTCDNPGFGTLLFARFSKSPLDAEKQLSYCVSQVRKTLKQLPDDATLVPRNIEPDKQEWNLRKVSQDEWCCGFWPGVLWYAQQRDDRLLPYAQRYTEALRSLAYMPVYDHDLGFQMICSFLNGYRQTKDEQYREVLLAAADSLATLFNPNVGTLLSWPRNVEMFGGHNTIMDNMMNLELLLWASQNGGGERLKDIAVSHADTTMKYQFRPNGSVYHVAVYDAATGQHMRNCNHQGFSDESTWARGQAWAVYGYTMMYRETRLQRYLDIAQKAAKLFLSRTPEDNMPGIPYWDFDDPMIPFSFRDASSACIVASALIDLSQYANDSQYLDEAVRMLSSLSTDDYQNKSRKSAFLNHSVGNLPVGSEIDYSIIYADYYYIEALTKLNSLP